MVCTNLEVQKSIYPSRDSFQLYRSSDVEGCSLDLQWILNYYLPFSNAPWSLDATVGAWNDTYAAINLSSRPVL